jgi:hypothetical protein
MLHVSWRKHERQRISYGCYDKGCHAADTFLASRSRGPSHMRMIAIGNAGQNGNGCGNAACDDGASTRGNLARRLGRIGVLRAELFSRTGRRRPVNLVTFFVEPLVRSFLPFRISDIAVW